MWLRHDHRSADAADRLPRGYVRRVLRRRRPDRDQGLSQRHGAETAYDETRAQKGGPIPGSRYWVWRRDSGAMTTRIKALAVWVVPTTLMGVGLSALSPDGFSYVEAAIVGVVWAVLLAVGMRVLDLYRGRSRR